MEDTGFHSGQAASVPGEGRPTSNAQLAAGLQAVALAIRIGGLEGLRSGAVKIGGIAGCDTILAESPQ